jgi:protein-disulfide isomerase
MWVKTTLLSGVLSVATLLVQKAGPVSAAEELSAAQQERIEAVVRDYILKNPEILIESLRRYEDKHRQASEEDAKKAIAANRDALEKNPTSPVAGNAQGDVTIVEFFDYRCGYCKKALPAVQELLKTDKNVRMVFKEFPILGPDSVIAARTALAVWKIAPAKYLPFHLALMESRGELSEERVLEIAKKVGLDVEKLGAAKADPEIDATIERNHELARTLQINGTPAFVVGGRLVPGALDGKTLREMVGTARAG